MSYTPPVSNAVNFVNSGSVYTPPLYSAVNFQPLIASPTIDATGVEATGAVGNVTVTILAVQDVYPTGVEATGQVGSVVAQVPFNNPSVTGVSATGAVGTVTPTKFKDVYPTGVSATATLGSVTTRTKQNNGNIGPPALLTYANGSTDGTFIADATLDSRNASLLILAGVRRSSWNYPAQTPTLPDWPPPIAVNPRKPSDGRLYIIDSLGNNWWIFMTGDDGPSSATPGFTTYTRDIGFVAYCMPQTTGVSHNVQWWGGVTTNLGSWVMYLSAWKNIAGPYLALWEHSHNSNVYPDENEVATFQIQPPQTPRVPGSLAYALAIIDNFITTGNDQWGRLGDYTPISRGTAFFQSMAYADAYKVLSGSPAQSPVWDTGAQYHPSYPTSPHNYEMRVGTIFCFFDPLTTNNGGVGNNPSNPNVNNIDIEQTGVSATGAVGTTTRTISTNPPVTGVVATSGLGTVSKTISVNVTGLQASAQLGTPSVYIPLDLFAAPQGVEATGAVGTVTFGLSTQVNVTGVEATGQIGGITYLGTWNGSVNLTGLEAQAQLGSVSVGHLDLAIDITGVSATGEVGQLGDPYGVEPVGVVDIQITVSGVAATGETGSAVPRFDAEIFLTGVSAQGVVGDVTVSADHIVNCTGVEATGVVGTASVAIAATASGVSATGQVGSVTLTYDCNVFPTGVAATGAVGTVITVVAAVITGVEAQGVVGSVAFEIGATATGIEAEGLVGRAVPQIDIDATGVEADGQVGLCTVLITLDLALEDDDYLWALREVESVVARADEAIYAIAREANEEQKQKEEVEVYAQRSLEWLYTVRDVDQLVATSEPATLTA